MPRLPKVRHSEANGSDLRIQPISEAFDGRCTEQVADERLAATRAIQSDLECQLKMHGMTLGGCSQLVRLISPSDLLMFTHVSPCTSLPERRRSKRTAYGRVQLDISGSDRNAIDPLRTSHSSNSTPASGRYFL